MRHVMGMLITLLACGQPVWAAPAATQPVVVNPRISTDKSVDTSTIDRILAGLVRQDMTDEQKVAAVFNWIRRVLYHGDGPAELAYDFGVMVHSLGNGSCLRQTTPMALLLKRLGYESRSWTHDGHHMLEVKYGGKWHCMDPHMCFYVYDRSSPPTIASVEQLRADATLADDAVKEGRACPGFLQCGDPPSTFGPGGEWVLDEGWPKTKVDEPFGRITLRRGETYIRTWMPGDEKYRFLKAWQFEYGPYHTCCLKADRQDIVNWPLYEPHVAAVGPDGKYKAARHWGAGRLAYKPDLHSDHYQDAVLSLINVAHDKARGLVVADSAMPGQVLFAVKCPYVITAGELTLWAAKDANISASVDIHGSKAWAPLKFVRDTDRLVAVFVEPVNGRLGGYHLSLHLQSGTAIEAMELTTYFELNPYSLPYLIPGKNVVQFDADVPGSPVKVEWTYAEGPSWKVEKAPSKTFTASGSFVIEVKGEKYPRNVSLVLSVAP